MAAQPGQWVQLVGNHEAYYLTPPKFHWPERLAEDDLETLYEWWRTRRMRVAAAIEVDGGTGELPGHPRRSDRGVLAALRRHARQRAGGGQGAERAGRTVSTRTGSTGRE